MTRPNWDSYFLDIARLVAARATCDRKKVGAVLVNDQHRIVSTGYNGAPRGMPSCDDEGHLLKEVDGRQSCVRTLHAESNAIDYAGREAQGCTLYVTVSPCYDCALRIVNAGIVAVRAIEFYQSRNSQMVSDLFSEAKIEYVLG